MFRLTTLHLLILLALCASASAQKSLLDVKITTIRHPAPGYFLLAPNSPDSLSFIDHAGKNVHAVAATQPSTFLFADSTVTHFIANKHVYVRRNTSMQVVDTLRMNGSYPVDFHEGHMLPNGNYVVLGADNRIVDMSAIVPGGSTTAIVAGAVFQERTLGGTTVFEWKSLDHIPVTDATEDIDLTQPSIDYIHVNSINVDTDGNYLVSCRHLDEVIKVSRLTGSVMWRFGGSKSKRNQFTILNDSEGGFSGFSHQHEAFRTAAGRIMLLDNGNLKPTPYTRAVEYEIDETLKTARRTWSYRPTPDIFTYSMGSVQELPNGNIVLGWGQTMSSIIAQEVSRDGTVQVELRQDSIRILSYRVQKAVFAMSGAERVVVSPGTYTLATADSNTRVSVALTRVDAPTSIIAERHSVAPHVLEFTDAAPCVPLNMRWVIRVSDTSKIAGSTRFALAPYQAEFLPLKAKLYRRPTEGKGKFTEVVTTFDAANIALVVNAVRAGEYALAFEQCYNPKPILPVANASMVSLAPTLAWSEALTSDGYDVEFYRVAVSTPLHVFKTTRLDTIITGLEPGALYAWRVRARRQTGNPWSVMSQFRTRIEAPSPLSPNALPDSLAVDLRPTFTWTSVPKATSYHVEVYKEGSNAITVDTIVTGTEVRWSTYLDPHTWYYWQARARIDAYPSAWSAKLSFITIPASPQLIAPRSALLHVDPNQSTLMWNATLGGISYHVRVYRDVLLDPLFVDTVVGLQSTTPVLDDVTRYYWQVRTVSRYGLSDWSNRRWFLTSGPSMLQAAILFNPVSGAVVDTLNTTLNWSEVDGASHYYVQLTTTPDFDNPDFEWYDVIAPPKSLPMLESGRLYQWRVTALNNVASGSWSTIGQFSTRPGPNDLLRPLIPIDGSHDVRAQSFAGFITDTSFISYRVEFSKTSSFAALAQSIGGAVSPLPFTLEEGTQYWWRVVGMRDGLDIDTSSTATFTTVISTIVVDGDDRSETTRISVRAGEVEITGEVGGSRVQVFDLVGRMVGSFLIPPDTHYWMLPFAEAGGVVYTLVVIPPSGRNSQAAVFRR